MAEMRVNMDGGSHLHQSSIAHANLVGDRRLCGSCNMHDMGPAGDLHHMHDGLLLSVHCDKCVASKHPLAYVASHGFKRNSSIRDHA